MTAEVFPRILSGPIVLLRFLLNHGTMKNKDDHGEQHKRERARARAGVFPPPRLPPQLGQRKLLAVFPRQQFLKSDPVRTVMSA